MTKIELTNMVEVTYSINMDKDKVPKTLETAMVHVPEESLPPMSEEDKKLGGRMLDVYFKKATEILANEMGPIYIYPNGFRFMGTMSVLY